MVKQSYSPLQLSEGKKKKRDTRGSRNGAQGGGRADQSDRRRRFLPPSRCRRRPASSPPSGVQTSPLFPLLELFLPKPNTHSPNGPLFGNFDRNFANVSTFPRRNGPRAGGRACLAAVKAQKLAIKKQLLFNSSREGTEAGRQADRQADADHEEMTLAG